MADEKNPTGFVIDGEVLGVPTLDTFDMDEAQILYDLSGIILEDFIPPHPDSTEEETSAVYALQDLKVRNPAFRRAFAHIAYRRAHPDAAFDDIHALTGQMNAMALSIAILTREDDEPDPSQSSPKPLESKNSTSETSEPSSSGKPSGSGSAKQDETLVLTGIGASGTSSPEWPVPRSAS